MSLFVPLTDLYRKEKKKKEVEQQSAIIHSVSSLMELTFRVITYRLLFPLLNKYLQIYLKMIW